jgi:hypothetical protein
MELCAAVAIVEDGIDKEREILTMHDWMIGLGFIVILITPCLIAMRSGVENSDDN